MVSTLDLLKRLSEYNVAYILVGGMACVVHGSQVVIERGLVLRFRRLDRAPTRADANSGHSQRRTREMRGRLS